MNEEEIYNTIEDINNTTTEEGDATSEETENSDLLNTVIGTVVIAGLTAIAYKIWKFFKNDEPADDGQPKKRRWRRKLEESLLKDGEIIVSKEEYEEFLKYKESHANQA